MHFFTLKNFLHSYEKLNVLKFSASELKPKPKLCKVIILLKQDSLKLVFWT